MEKISDNYDLIWILFQDDFKRFKKWELINLWEDCYFEKEKTNWKLVYKFVEKEFNSLNYILWKINKNKSIQYNIKAIIWNNWVWKSTILKLIDIFYSKELKKIYGDISSNYLYDDIIKIEIEWSKYNISDLIKKEILLVTIWINQNILYLAKKRESSITNTIKTIYLSKWSIWSTYKISDFIKNNNKFKYFRDDLLINTLKITKNKTRIEKIIKIEVLINNVYSDYNINSKRDIIMLVIKFLLLSDILLKYFNDKNLTEFFSLDEKLLNFSLDLYWSYYWYEEAKIKVYNYIVWLSLFVWKLKGKKRLKYLMYSYFYYENIVISWDFLKIYFDRIKNNRSKKYWDIINQLKTYWPNYLLNCHLWFYDYLISNSGYIQTLFNDFGLEFPNIEFIDKHINDLDSIYKNIEIFLDKKNNRNYNKDDNNFYNFSKININTLFDNIFNSLNLDIKEFSSLSNITYKYFDYSFEKYIDYSKKFFKKIGKEENSINLSSLYYFDVDILIKKNDNDYFYVSDFSSWEKQLIWIISRLNNSFKQIEINNKIVNIILDEPEISLHLEWQRKFIYYLIEWINSILKWKKNIKVNIYIATHSPFIISDLPKENVIFLYKNDELDETSVKSFDTIKEESNLIIDNTFIANIPELIRWPFFLDDIYWELWNHFIQSIKSEKDFKKAKDITWDKFNFEYLFIKNYKND